MKDREFKEWLINNNIFSTRKQINDCVSRARTVERKFAEVIEDFDLDKEYKKDKLEGVRKALSVYGTKHMNDFIPKGTTTSFNIGNRSMGNLNVAILKYQRFKKSERE